ncbi:multi-sensor signal transduction histidine kinase [Calothrix sp. NIES-4101]|nr:multi-sensor signal transduction histidine kinase [Calothrix sp. NIES-4101]
MTFNQANNNYINLGFKVDLSNCDREPIQFSGTLQPHGVMLVLLESNLQIIQVSDNTFSFFNLHPQELLNQDLSKLLEPEQISLLHDCLQQEDLQTINPIEINIKILDKSLFFDGILHRHEGIIILELELVVEKKNNFFNFYHLLKSALSKLQNTSNLQELSQILVREVRKISNFDRVMIYQFDENWNGKVIAEDKTENMTSYLNLHYPASDIPQQARQLYCRNWLRLIPDVNYQPTAIIPTNNPLTNQPLDLTHSVLRSVSPLHIEYMQNMGLQASMSISIIKNQQLWGLIACHHQTPKYVQYEIRHACEFLGRIASLEMIAKEDNEDFDYKFLLSSVHSKLVEYMSVEADFIDGLIAHKPNILDLVNAQGAAICFEDKYYFLGNVPPVAEIQNLWEWINQHFQEDIFATDCLFNYYPQAENFKDIASGLLALSIAKSQKNYVLWFRPEVIQTVNWGGNPHKPVEVSGNGELRLSPRKSFALWQETVRMKSLPWKHCEINSALELRSTILGVILRKADELAKLNFELERSNKELDAFAYIASHDLKEPLRGIHNYSSFLIEDYGEILNNDGKSKLQTLMRLTQRMEDLIESLLHFSRLGRVDLSMQETNLNDVVSQILDLLRARIEETKVEIRIHKILPTISCDRIQIGEVFSNLIANAIKYNDSPEKWIEISYLEDSHPLIFYVRDNGIGIREKHFEGIFRIFKRLHAPSKYGGGTGAGLTIAKKIVERHGGNIWLESSYGQGSTFYFTLEPDS